MSDLNLGPPLQPSRAKYVLVAAAVVALIVTVILLVTPHHISELAIERTQVFAPHTTMQTPKFGMHVLGQETTDEDNLYVVATVRFKDTLRLPIDPMGASAQMLDSTGASADGSLVAQRDLPRLGEVFPELAPMVTHPLTLDRLEPGETREGQLVLLFPGLNAKDWSTKKSATLTIRLAQQPPQTTPIP
jgi:hypothetical protein